MTLNNATFTIEDYSQEKGSMSINIGPVTVVNFTALHDAIDDLEAVMPNMILGAIRKTNVHEIFNGSVAAVTDVNAQRERKWLVTYRDETEFLDVADTIMNTGYGQVYNVEIPTAKLSLLDTESDELDLSVAAVAAWITAFEAVQISPTGGDVINVISIRHVGRSS